MLPGMIDRADKKPSGDEHRDAAGGGTGDDADHEVEDKDNQDEDDEDEDDEGWLTPETFDRTLESLQLGAETGDDATEQSPVGCMTADFSMQNVLLQMSLRLVAVNGLRIRRVQRWAHQCHACYAVSYRESAAMFCPKCGNAGTMIKVSVELDADGTRRIQGPRRLRRKKGVKVRLVGIFQP